MGGYGCTLRVKSGQVTTARMGICFVAIAVGSDDPLTFSTQLLREYTLLHHAACSPGYPERTVQDWLETIRRTGMDARFTLAWRPNAGEKTKELIRDLSRYLHVPGYMKY